MCISNYKSRRSFSQQYIRDADFTLFVHLACFSEALKDQIFPFSNNSYAGTIVFSNSLLNSEAKLIFFDGGDFYAISSFVRKARENIQREMAMISGEMKGKSRSGWGSN